MKYPQSTLARISTLQVGMRKVFDKVRFKRTRVPKMPSYESNSRGPIKGLRCLTPVEPPPSWGNLRTNEVEDVLAT